MAAVVTVSEPFDLDAVPSDGEPFCFKFRGASYQLPPQGTWPVEVMEHFNHGAVGMGLACLLGEDAAERLLMDGITVGHLMALMQAATVTPQRRKWFQR